MDKKLLSLNVGDKININNKTYTIKNKNFYKAEVPHESDVIRYEFDDNYVIEITWNIPNFFQIVNKKIFNLFTITKSINIKISNIKIIK